MPRLDLAGDLLIYRRGTWLRLSLATAGQNALDWLRVKEQRHQRYAHLWPAFLPPRDTIPELFLGSMATSATSCAMVSGYTPASMSGALQTSWTS